MTISQAVCNIKSYHKGTVNSKTIDDETSRDQILYGNPEQELKGVVTTCFASVDVIRKAHELGANLIISHEALFWNHGDHTDWLKNNKTCQAKKALLDECGIVVWRDHDYIHSGIPLEDGTYADGIFYGVMKELGWDKYVYGDMSCPAHFCFPKTTVRSLGEEIMRKLSLGGIKIIGNPDSPAHNVWVCGHIDGRQDNEVIRAMDEDDIDTVITLECIDYTAAEYVRDSTMAGIPKTIMAVGHFNAEEPGMKYMLNYLCDALGEAVPVWFVPSTDMYNYL